MSGLVDIDAWHRRAMARKADADCKGPVGALRPQIDRNRCEGKADCVRVCPYEVFSVGVITAADRRELSLLGRLKSLAHRGKTAYTPKADACMACGLCVTACPEQAIKLVRSAP
jgi:NAD-dependent dihydropyrimidine dehydrogenase PreA subunit